MENATDALKMAGAVLIFVLAISIIILAFGQVRETADTILDYRDRETVYIDGNYYYQITGTERQVGLETIIPSIFRAYLENYKIVFEGLGTEPIYTVVENNGVSKIQKFEIDLEVETLGGDNKKAEFLCGILYHDFTNITVPTEYGSMSQEEFFKQKNFSKTIELPNESLYKRLQEAIKDEKKIKEYLGVYYQKDTPNTPETMKDEKRIITYEIVNE